MAQGEKRTFFVVCILLMGNFLFAQQEVSLDWKLHDVGKVREFISNVGSLWPTFALWTDYPGLIYCEFPPNQSEEHIGEGGIWVGAIVGGDSLVSVTTGWNSTQEFFPSSQPWDTIWVVNKLDTVDIPYWPGYVGKSDQDFVCRYSDYNITNITNHIPMYLDVIQVSHAWSSSPLDEMIIYEFYVISTRIDLQQAYIAYWLDGNVGFCSACRNDYGFGRDDVSHYYPDEHFGVAVDVPGGVDGTAVSPIGMKIYLPDEIPANTLNWTFDWYPGGIVPAPDGLRYADMAEGVIMQNQQSALNGSQFIISFGPFDLNVGDTLSFFVAQVMGSGRLVTGEITDVDWPDVNPFFDNLRVADLAIANDFKFPSPPPPPPLRVNISSGKVALEWEARPGDRNPETYQDPYRADGAQQPFEGYRVYKSTQSATGPWTLLAEYDIAGNDFGANTGLVHEFTNTGLLDYFEYFYSVTAFSKPDTGYPITGGFPSQESSINATAIKVVPGPDPQQAVGKVSVVPNPYRGDIAYYGFNPPWEKPDPTRKIWLEQDRLILFINLPRQCEIKVYTLAGDLVATIQHDDPVKGYEGWNLTSSIGQAISSGIYLFTVENNSSGEVQVGKFVIVK